MIVSSLISDFTGEEIYSQCFTIGPYLLGLGIGSYYFDKKFKNNLLKKLWNLEYVSSLLLPLYPLIFTIFLFLYIGLSDAQTSLNDKKTSFFIIGFGSVLSLIAGILGGGQLPLIMKATLNTLKIEILLAVNYLGPLLAGPFIVYFSSSSTDYSIQSGYIGMTQFLGLLILITKFDIERKRKIILLLFPLMIIILSAKIFPKIEYITAKASYLNPKFKIKDLTNLGNTINFLENYAILERQKTPYQIIEVFTYEGDQKDFNDSTTTLYLNRKIQFNNFSSDIYHESMLFGALNLFEKSPKEILILGGGDGILLDMIQNNLPESSTTLVELDEKMIEWAQNNFFLKTLNQNVFSNLNKNNKVIIGDAIMQLRKFQNKKKFDLIFIDFPFPNGHDLSKLYSEEFYSLVKNVSKEDTLVTIDLPLEMKNKNEFDEETLTILKTILKSGFKNQIGYGPHSSFVTVTQSRKPLSFNYKTLPNNLSLATKINLFSYIENKEIDKIEISKRVNSMFWPKRK